MGEGGHDGGVDLYVVKSLLAHRLDAGLVEFLENVKLAEHGFNVVNAAVFYHNA